MRSILEKKNLYEGFSLVEMLITIVIIGVVMLTAATSLTTLIKISTVSSNKTRVRSESEFVLELVRRTVRNSNPSDVYIYDSSNVRTYTPEDNLVVNKDGADITGTYASSLSETISGNEIHFRPYGYDNWICIGFFKSTNDANMGYILRTSADTLSDHASCFVNTTTSPYLIALNSEVVDVTDFKIAYTILKDTNYLIRFDIKAEPTQWYLGTGAPVRREVYRQAVVSTEGIVW